jgi:16S rRNA (cytosine967-C5)-methyltransferase
MSAHTHPDYPDAVRLATPAPVHALPGFEEGWVTAARLVATIESLVKKNEKRVKNRGQYRAFFRGAQWLIV